MNGPRVLTAHLLPELLNQLLAVLGGLAESDWGRPTACPGWSVHEVAAHLLGVEVGNVSSRRDGWRSGPGPGEDLDAWLNRFNGAWVESARRLSPAVLTSLLALAGSQFAAYAARLDPDQLGAPVGWATGEAPAPVWLDLAREYMERFVHQQQIRHAVGQPPLPAEFAAPALATAVHVLPMALATVERVPGTSVSFTAEGEGGGTWFVVREPDGWQLRPRPADEPVLTVTTTADGALMLFVRDPAAPRPDLSGDPTLGEAILRAKAVLG